MSKLHWLAFRSVSGIGGTTAKELVERFGSVEMAFDASDEELLAVPRITPKIVAELRAVSLDALEMELMSLSEDDMEILTWDDPDYPANLYQTNSASPGPPLLFVRGDLRSEDARAVAVVGTRNPMSHFIDWAETIAYQLAQRGITVVSGLAVGIDTAAHVGALQAQQGRTLAVLGSGLRVIHPRSNLELSERIVERGALLSECLPNTPPRGSNLMARDRIISGLSRMVIVVEAGEKSGSVDTANKAMHQGRTVFAVPGSAGTDALLAQGAEELDMGRVDWDRLSLRIDEIDLAKAGSSGDQNRQMSFW